VARLVRRPNVSRVLDFCAEDPVERVFLEDVARRGLGRFLSLEERGRAVALCHVGANVVPSGRETVRFADAAAEAEPRMIVGEERAVTELWDGIAPRLPKPLDDRPGQPVYVLEAEPPPGESGLRAATVEDLDVLVPAAAAAYLEEVGVDAYARDPALFEWRTRAQVEGGRSWVWREGDQILFKAEASAWTPHAVQLQQVWVDPEVRGRGYAQRGMRDLIRLLLRSVPRVCLFVRADNPAAIRLYEAAGMDRVGTYRSVLF
jgi:uncharacterized protein